MNPLPAKGGGKGGNVATYELKLASGKVVKWEGKDGVDAAKRYVDCNREAVVIAWRYPPHGLSIGVKPIVD